MTHYAADELAAYLALELPEDREMEIEEHLAECDACTALARQSTALLPVVQQWTAHTHGEAFRRDAMMKALAQVAETQPAWSERIGGWRTALHSRAETVARVVMGASGTASRVVAESLDALARPGAGFAFAPAPVRGTSAPDGGLAAILVAEVGGDLPAQVAVDPATGEVVVRVDALPAGQRTPLVLLIALAGDAAPQVRELARPRGGRYWVARFEQVPPGEYGVAFEPLS
jgi:hypothetical protein